MVFKSLKSVKKKSITLIGKLFFIFLISSFLYSKSKITFLKFLKLKDSSVNNKCIECLKTLSNLELYWSAIKDLNKSNNSSVEATT